MKITWIGHSCFKIENEKGSVVIDPYEDGSVPGLKPVRESADAVLISHGHGDHSARKRVTVTGSGECPFAVTKIETFHDPEKGALRGPNTVHILEADGLKLVHMGDIGTKLLSGEAGRILGADALMITAGSCTGLPSQEVWRLCEEVFPRVVIPMHYRFGEHGARRLEHLDDLLHYFNAPGLAHFYESDTITITPDMEPQVAVLKYLGPESWGALAAPSEKPERRGLLARLRKK